MLENNVAIVIPIYKTNLTELEMIFLYQNLEVLNKYKHYFIIPDNLNLQNYESLIKQYNINILKFNYKYFINIDSYNKLCFNYNLYDKFLNYTYILIAQLDAFIFKDNLLEWCSYNYDYIGAPWCCKCNICSQENIKKSLQLNLVGNGRFIFKKS